jgi:hypothetical protein
MKYKKGRRKGKENKKKNERKVGQRETYKY